MLRPGFRHAGQESVPPATPRCVLRPCPVPPWPRKARRHLYGGKQRVHAAQSRTGHGNADDRSCGAGSHCPGQMCGHARRADEHLASVLFEFPHQRLCAFRRAVRGRYRETEADAQLLQNLRTRTDHRLIRGGTNENGNLRHNFSSCSAPQILRPKPELDVAGELRRCRLGALRRRHAPLRSGNSFALKMLQPLAADVAAAEGIGHGDTFHGFIGPRPGGERVSPMAVTHSTRPPLARILPLSYRVPAWNTRTASRASASLMPETSMPFG